MKFEEAKTEEEIIQALKERAKKQANTSGKKNRYIYHYTSEKAVIGILKSKKFFLSPAQNMNDRYEEAFLKKCHAGKLFYSCFSTEEHESMAMWSMYSQPWENGVAIKIPVASFKKWMELMGTFILHREDVEELEASDQENKPIFTFDRLYEDIMGIRKKLPDLWYNPNRAKIHVEASKNTEPNNSIEIPELMYTSSYYNVAYSKLDSLTSYTNALTCGGTKNVKLVGSPIGNKMAGFIKDNIWDYEKELRIMVSYGQDTVRLLTRKFHLKPERVLLDIPDDILDSFEFVTGPRYCGNLTKRIREELNNPLFDSKRITESSFTGRLGWVYCDSCPYIVNEEKKNNVTST